MPRRSAAVGVLFMLFASATAQAQPANLPIVELRQYTLLPGQRDVLIQLFEREFIESQEATGMAILGQFRDLDRPDRFVWIRAFPDMPSRARSLEAFYGGTVWRQHSAAANATMSDVSNVLLLRPARADSGFSTAARVRAPRGATTTSSAVVMAVVCPVGGAEAGSFVELFEQRVRPALDKAGGRTLGYFVTEASPNNFPKLPVREGEYVFVWLSSFATESELTALLGGRVWTEVTREMTPRLKGSLEILRLAPTARSLIGNMTVNGASDFDFLIGNWSVRHRRLERRLANSTTWVEFSGPASTRKILGGFGNIDEITINLPTGAYVGATLRLFNPTTERWTIYWMDGRNPALDPPMVGQFDAGRGVFYGDDTFEGKPIRVRFIWKVVSQAACTWEQAFSADGGQSWETNWVMEFTRVN